MKRKITNNNSTLLPPEKKARMARISLQKELLLAFYTCVSIITRYQSANTGRLEGITKDTTPAQKRFDNNLDILKNANKKFLGKDLYEDYLTCQST